MTRLERLKALMDGYSQTPDDYDDDEVEENVRLHFNGERYTDRFCCVTVNDGKFFFLPQFKTQDEATSRAVEFAQDDIFPEIPVEVHDLDTGKSVHPRWHTLEWA